MVEQTAFEQANVGCASKQSHEDNGMYRMGESVSRDSLKYLSDLPVQVARI